MKAAGIPTDDLRAHAIAGTQRRPASRERSLLARGLQISRGESGRGDWEGTAPVSRFPLVAPRNPVILHHHARLSFPCPDHRGLGLPRVHQPPRRRPSRHQRLEGFVREGSLERHRRRTLEAGRTARWSRRITTRSGPRMSMRTSFSISNSRWRRNPTAASSSARATSRTCSPRWRSRCTTPPTAASTAWSARSMTRCRPRRAWPKPVGEWNRFTITCKDSLVTVVFNGEEVIHADLNDWPEAKKNPDGTPNKFPVALQGLRAQRPHRPSRSARQGAGSGVVSQSQDQGARLGAILFGQFPGGRRPQPA